MLDDHEVDQAFKSAMLTLPSEQEIATLIARNVDPGAIHDTREALRAEIGKGLGDILLASVEEHRKPRSLSALVPQDTGRRSLRYAVLHAIAGGDPKLGTKLATGAARPSAEHDG